MTTQEYIDSGILELFVYGKLSETEMEEVMDMANKNETVLQEIMTIEKSCILLSGAVSPRISGKNYEEIKQAIFENQSNVIAIEKKNTSLFSYLGWAASILFLTGFGIMTYLWNESLYECKNVTKEKIALEKDYSILQNANSKTNETLAHISNKQTIQIQLEGQEIAPSAFAKIYWNTNSHKAIVDISGLPKPPNGKVYQVWSLKLNPLTPSNMGIINKSQNNEMLHSFENIIDAQAFGITLEPEGGSETPTLEQLYALGKV